MFQIYEDDDIYNMSTAYADIIIGKFLKLNPDFILCYEHEDIIDDIQKIKKKYIEEISSDREFFSTIYIDPFEQSHTIYFYKKNRF